jgi:hypothetical protein
MATTQLSCHPEAAFGPKDLAVDFAVAFVLAVVSLLPLPGHSSQLLHFFLRSSLTPLTFERPPQPRSYKATPTPKSTARSFAEKRGSG